MVRSATSTASAFELTARVLFADEIDGYELSAGAEGDPVELAMRRTMTFANRKIVLASTPVDADTSRILRAYDYLKSLDIGYYFYSGRYLDAIAEVLDAGRKTIVRIPNVNARESLGDKIREAEDIMQALGTWMGADPDTGFQLVERPDGTILKIADLVDDDGALRDRVIGSLKDPAHADDRDHVDIIIALGMAKEGFDWIWCEHALTVGYRSSLTEIVQIIGRATRDAPGKTRAKFTNLIAEPDASEETVNEAVNDTLMAIAASLLMEQVLAPRFTFKPKAAGKKEGFDYGEAGYQDGETNVGFNEATGQFHMEVGGLVPRRAPKPRRYANKISMRSSRPLCRTVRRSSAGSSMKRRRQRNSHRFAWVASWPIATPTCRKTTGRLCASTPSRRSR